MNKLESKIITLLILAISLFSFGCFQDYEETRNERSDKIIKQFNLQLKNKDYEEIYKGLSSTAKSLTPKDEFNERIEKLVGEFEKVDESLELKEDINMKLYNEMVDTHFIYRKIEKNRKKLDIEVTVDTDENKLFDVCIFPSETDDVTNRICLTNALRKI